MRFKTLLTLGVLVHSLVGVALVPSVCALEPIQKDEQIRAMSAYMEAQRAFERGDYDEAAEKAERAYILIPNDLEIKQLLSKIQQAKMSSKPAVALNEQTKAPVYQPSKSQQNAARKIALSGGGREQEVAPGFQTQQPSRSMGNDGVEDVVMPARTVSTAAADDAKTSSHIPRLSWDALERWFPTRPDDGRFEVLATTSSRAGSKRFYKEGIGTQPLVPGLGFSARTEIYEEAPSVDGFVTLAKQLNLDEVSEFKSAVLPIFTRSWAFRAVADYDKWPRFTYEFDKRHIYHEFQRRFAFKDRNLETHYFSLLYSFPEIPLLGTVSVQPAYKRVFQESDDNDFTFADIDEGLLAVSIRHNPNVESFFQWNGKASENTKGSPGNDRTQVFTTQLRLGIPSLKMFAIPNFEYSRTRFNPGDDEYIKKDIFVDWGIDISESLRASSKEQIVISEVSSSTASNTNVEAEAFNSFNKLSYGVTPDIDLSLLMDYSKARGLNAFDNYALGAEVQFFRPGVLRASVGYKWTDYYIINDDLKLLYFKLFLFQ